MNNRRSFLKRTVALLAAFSGFSLLDKAKVAPVCVEYNSFKIGAGKWIVERSLDDGYSWQPIGQSSTGINFVDYTLPDNLPLGMVVRYRCHSIDGLSAWKEV